MNSPTSNFDELSSPLTAADLDPGIAQRILYRRAFNGVRDQWFRLDRRTRVDLREMVGLPEDPLQHLERQIVALDDQIVARTSYVSQLVVSAGSPERAVEAVGRLGSQDPLDLPPVGDIVHALVSDASRRQVAANLEISKLPRRARSTSASESSSRVSRVAGRAVRSIARLVRHEIPAPLPGDDSALSAEAVSVSVERGSAAPDNPWADLEVATQDRAFGQESNAQALASADRQVEVQTTLVLARSGNTDALTAVAEVSSTLSR